VPTTDIAGNPRAGTRSSIGAFHKGTTDVYYSLSPYGTGDLKTGSPTCGIASGVMTLNTAQTGNIGQGCKITYDTSKVVYIKTVTDSTHFVVVDKYGVTPPDIASGTTVNSIAHVWASMQAAETGAEGSSFLNTVNLTAANVVLNFACYYDHDAHAADTATLQVSGYTTDSTRYIRFYTPTGGTQSIYRQRHLGKWSTDYFHQIYTIASASDECIETADPYVVLEGLQCKGDANTAGDGCVVYSAEGYLTLDSCILWFYTSDAGYITDIRTSDVNVKNCLGFLTGTGTGARGFLIRASNSTMRNTTFDGGGVAARGIWSYGTKGVLTAVNCISMRTTESGGDWYGVFASVTYCASEDNDESGTGNISIGTLSDAFTDYANGDYSVKDTDSVLYDAGTNLSAYFTTDIAGTTRSTWDIGAFEYVASGAEQGTCEEGLTFSVTSAKSAIYQAIITEAMGLTSPSGKNATFNTTALTPASFNSTASSIAQLLGALSSNITVSDIASRLATIRGEAQTSINLTASASKIATLNALLDNIVNFESAITNIANLDVTLSSPLGIGDWISIGGGSIAIASDQLNIDDLTTVAGTFNKIAQAVLQLTASSIINISTSGAAAQSLNLNAFTSTEAAFIASASTPLSLHDSIATTMLLAALASSVINVSSYISGDAASVLEAFCLSTMGFHASDIANLTSSISLLSALTTTDGATAVSTFTKTIAQALTLASTAERDKIAGAALAQLISILSTTAATLHSTASLQTTVNINATSTNIATMLTQLISALQLDSAANWLGVALGILADSLGIEAASTVSRFVTALSIGTAAFTDTMTNNVMFQATLQENISLTEVVAILRTVASVCADVFNIQDICYWLSATGAVSVTFTLAKGSVTFALTKPTITFN